jgi:hypothetical protein
MLSIREYNIGHSIYACADDAQPLLDILGQGDGIKVCAQWYARAIRRNPDAERVLEACAIGAHLTTLARKQHPTVTEDQHADLIAFIFERGVNMARAA